MGMTPQHFHTIPTSCATMHTKTLYMHLAYSICIDEQGTQLCSLHSLTHKTISAILSSNKISQRNLNSNISHRPSIAHALHSFCIQSRQTITISAMLSICSNPQHNSVIGQIPSQTYQGQNSSTSKQTQ